MRVLIVDDSRTIREILSGMLVQCGVAPYDITAVASGEEALVLFDEAKPDVVFLDVEMKGIDGAVVCEKLLDMRPRLAIVVTTASSRDDPRVRRMIALGARDLLEKPLRLDRVRAAMGLGNRDPGLGRLL